MLLILGCALPDVCDESLEHYCQSGMEHLAERLDINQIRHLDKFAGTGKTLRMRAACIMGRLMLFAHLPASARLRTGRNGIPLLEDKNLAVGFSHTPRASFCLLCQTAGGIIQAGIDAEAWNPRSQEDGDFSNLAGLKKWLKLEAILKAGGAGLSGAKRAPGLFLPKGGTEGWRWRYLAFPGHIVCVAANTRQKLRPAARWLTACDFNFYGKTFATNSQTIFSDD